MLKEHEEVIEEHVIEIMNKIIKDGVLHKPLLVDINYNIILDGHHRYHALKRLKARRIPVFYVDYFSKDVIVSSWRHGIIVGKDLVIRIALSGRKLPPKTTRHILRGISVPEINLPLTSLLKL